MKADNYLDYVPCKNRLCIYEYDTYGNVVIIRHNTGVYNRIAQLLLCKPKISYIHLDDMGSYIWSLIDGSNDVYDIAKAIYQKYGDEAEPLYERLIIYMRALVKCGFIVVIK